ncbi:terminase TerL endonuclease subunit [Limibacter armeniacum]|uniref:terminase TerL endonuclease subunit n=1 Tax=Limibacter armeniacum TaxID=466084 RepID=UPI002FE5EFDA
MERLKRYLDYIEDPDNELVGNHTRLAAKRFRIMETLFEFRREGVEDFIFFAEECCGFQLMPFQVFLAAIIFGFYHVGTNNRVVKEFILFGSRKIGKTAIISLINLFIEQSTDLEDVELYTCATKREQAQILVRSINKVVQRYDPDEEILEANKNDIKNKHSLSFIRAMANNSMKSDGLEPLVATFDEISAYENYDMVGVLESGMVTTFATGQSLILKLTTANFNIEYPFHAELERYRLMLQGKLEEEEGEEDDYSTFPLLYEMDDPDMWESPQGWAQACPALDIHPVNDDFSLAPINFYYRRLAKAKKSGLDKLDFKVKNCNLFTRDNTTSFVELEYWDECKRLFEEDMFYDRKCIMGFDLSSTSDLTSINLFYLPTDEDPFFRTKVFAFTTQKYFEEHRGTLQKFLDDGELIIMGERTINELKLLDFIEELINDNLIVSLSYDRWGAKLLIKKIIDRVGDLVDIVEEYKQTSQHLTAPIKYLKKLILDGSIAQDGNGLMRWCMGNVNLEVYDSGNVRMSKTKSSGKIDPVIALVNAVGRYIDLEELEGNLIDEDSMLVI